MNRYPLWKYLLIAATLILAAIYALPNLFGETPAVQVSTNRQAIVINEQTENRVSAALQAARASIDARPLAMAPATACSPMATPSACTNSMSVMPMKPSAVRR